jgi:hypothetical protein
MSKYRNKKVVIDGIKFDSAKEGVRYTELKILLKAGLITDLELQPVFEIQPSYKRLGKTIRAIKYLADFRYIENGKTVVEDVKGFKTDIYKLKKKLVEYKYDVIINEI